MALLTGLVLTLLLPLLTCLLTCHTVPLFLPDYYHLPYHTTTLPHTTRLKNYHIYLLFWFLRWFIIACLRRITFGSLPFFATMPYLHTTTYVLTVGYCWLLVLFTQFLFFTCRSLPTTPHYHHHHRTVLAVAFWFLPHGSLPLQ